MVSKNVKKYLYFIPIILLVIFNIQCFTGEIWEIIQNIGIILLVSLILFWVVFKYKNIESKFTESDNKLMLIMLFAIMPMFELMFLFTFACYGFILNYIILLAIQGLFYLLTRNVKASIICQLIFFYIFYCISEILILVRGTPFVPIDILCIKVAFSLSNNYGFKMTLNLLRATIVTYVHTCITIIISNKCKKLFKKCFIIISSIAIICLIIIFLLMNFLVNFNIYSSEDAINTYGMPLVFCRNILDLKFEKPVNYTKEDASGILKNYIVEAKSEDDLPNIIVVMSEAFSNLNYIEEIEMDVNPMEYYNSLDENTVRGDILVNIRGGGTSETEFEFLTGMSKIFMGKSSNTYLQYINKNTRSIVSDLKSLKYKTYAIHPYWEYTWRRNDVYKYFGFDDYISAEDMLKYDASNSALGVYADNREYWKRVRYS